jgi:ABC-2 type transport system ATP-binding protein
MLKIKNVTKSYAKGTFKAVDDISLDVRKGEIFGFLGPNGAGKTTTIKMVCGLLKQDQGSISVDHLDTVNDSIQTKSKISYVPDNPEIMTRLTGIQYLNFMADIYSVPKEGRKELIQSYLEIFELTDAVNSQISSYSHGMQQKIVLIGALLHDPDLFILDEPMVGLDPKSSFKLKEIMRQRCDKGKTVFFSTHVLEVAEKLCDRLAIINKGKIIAMGTMEEIKKQLGKDGSLEKIFLELTE